MRGFNRIAGLGLALIAIMPVAAEASHLPTVGLGTAGSFAILAGQGVTNTGPSVIKGDIGTHPNPAVTGFPPGSVQNGTINPSYTAAAKDALVTAYNDAAGRTPVTTIPTELGGQTLNHGTYDSQAGDFQITGTLTLDGQNDPSAVWVFKTASTLVTAASSNVALVNGASACNVFWQVGSSATLGTGSTLRGTVMALTSITVTTNATLIGRALARNGAVTLDSDQIDASPCLTAPPTPSDGTTTSSGTTASTPTRSRRQLPETGPQIPNKEGMMAGFGLILIGLFYNWLGASSGALAIALKGYAPKRRASRWR